VRYVERATRHQQHARWRQRSLGVGSPQGGNRKSITTCTNRDAREGAANGKTRVAKRSTAPAPAADGKKKSSNASVAAEGRGARPTSKRGATSGRVLRRLIGTVALVCAGASRIEVEGNAHWMTRTETVTETRQPSLVNASRKITETNFNLEGRMTLDSKPNTTPVASPASAAPSSHATSPQ
jgi:hypothetical protein